MKGLLLTREVFAGFEQTDSSRGDPRANTAKKSEGIVGMETSQQRELEAEGLNLLIKESTLPMRKRKEQQKNQRDYQMTLFDKNGEPLHDAGSGTTGYQGVGVDYLS